MVASSAEFQTKVLRRIILPDEYELYTAALEWDLRRHYLTVQYHHLHGASDPQRPLARSLLFAAGCKSTHFRFSKVRPLLAV
jgi:hypothetical protein